MDIKEPTVFVVDDDIAVLGSLKALIESVGIDVETFSTADDFLNTYKSSRCGCLVLDIRMPGMSGLELQKVLKDRDIFMPVIIISGHADIEMAVRAMKRDAFDFIEKPFSDQVLLDRIQQAIAKDTNDRRQQTEIDDLRKRFSLLTGREWKIMEMVTLGKTSKEIGPELGISHKTVEVHRTNIMEKLGVKSAIQLTRLAWEAKLLK
jgi:two-component system response regulator FixJ